ncbi:putative LSM14 A-like protein, partial [Naja naja]
AIKTIVCRRPSVL